MFALQAAGQSGSPDFPTPLYTNEINGTISARRLGDARTTTYYYVFHGGQGDLFLNLVSRNFTGDVDVFTAQGLRPLTKIVVYADLAVDSETGRLIYLRKPEKLLLRVQGRTTSEDPATFRIKFGGSFVAATADDVPEGPDLPVVRREPPRTTTANARDAEERPGPVAEPAVPSPVKLDPPASEKRVKIDAADVIQPKPEESEIREKPRPEVVVTDPLKTPETERPKVTDPEIKVDSTARAEPPPTREPETVVPDAAEPAVVEPAAVEPVRAVPRRRRTASRRTPPLAEPAPNPLANVRLVIELKNGDVIERSMADVLRFAVDRGVLVVTEKGGAVKRYPILEVLKVTIQ